MSQPSQIKTQAWFCVALLWCVAFLNYLDRMMIMTMRESLVAAIPMTDKQFGLLSSIFLWVYGLLSPFAGFMADRFSRRGIIIGSLFVWSAITWLTGHAQTFNQLLVARALMGVSEAVYIPAALALIVDYHRGSTRSLATGIHISGCLVGSGLGGLGGLLAERFTWSYAFNLFGLIGIAYSIVLMFFLREAPREQVTNSDGTAAGPASFGPALKSLFSRGSFILALAFWGLLGLVGWGVNGWMPTYFKEHFNLSQGDSGFYSMGFLQAAALVGVVAGGAFTDRCARTNERGRISVTVIGLCVAAPGILLAANTSFLPWAIAGLILYGLTRSLADANMMPILCLVADPRYRATGYGVLNLFSCIVGGITIYIGGALRDAQVDVTRVFQFSAVSLLACAAIIFFVKASPAPQTNNVKSSS